MRHKEIILVLDFGSQYTQLIARRIRELGVYTEIKPFNISLKEIRAINPRGIVLSGGPSSVYAPHAPLPPAQIFDEQIPILGICYGLQVIAFIKNGQVDPAKHREYGRAALTVDDNTDLLANVDDGSQVWMSHGDHLTKLPQDFKIIGHTQNAHIAAIKHMQHPIFGIQFHPEVAHTVQGMQILQNFAKTICGCSGDWNTSSFVDTTIDEISKQIGSEKAICALSGGVDSTVAAYLVGRAIGHRLVCIFVDTGLLRQDEANQVREYYTDAPFSFEFVDARELFLEKLKDVTDPEKKRKIIGNEFINVFEERARHYDNSKFLVQGTLYPDVIESVSTKGPSATIKSHHNVGGLPEKMGLKLVEPLKELFKDKVREVGKELNISEHILKRHPFPGPGLAVRILGPVTKERLNILRPADHIFIQELKQNNLYDSIWQAFTVLLPIQTVGVMGDERTYENVIALRAVTSLDGMTADWADIPKDVLANTSNRIINEVQGVNRVVYDISSKPPSTIEWE